MPLYRFAKLSSTSFYLIWRTKESLEALRAQLCPLFLADFHSLHLSAQDKIGQSLAVRIALYHLLKQLGLPITSLTKNERGKPLLSDHSGYISFTHTRYFSAVALSTASPIGIDIEMVQPSLQRIQRRFLTEEEAQSANHCLTKLAIYWSAKEALYKCLDEQLCFTFKDACIEPFSLETEGKLVAHLNKEKYGMGYEQIVDSGLPPHVLVYCNG